MRPPPSSVPFTDSASSGSLSSPFCVASHVLLGGPTVLGQGSSKLPPVRGGERGEEDGPFWGSLGRGLFGDYS